MGNSSAKLKCLPAGYYNPVKLEDDDYYEKYEVTNNESGREEILEAFHCQSPLMGYLTKYFSSLDAVKTSRCKHLVQYSYYGVLKKYVVIIRPKFKERLADRISQLSEKERIIEYQRICECLNELHKLTTQPNSPHNVQCIEEKNNADITSGSLSLSDFYISTDINNNEIVVMDNYSKYLLYKAVQLPFPINDENVNTLSKNFINKIDDRCFNIENSITKNDDIWSVGCILFKLLKNIYPFQGFNDNNNMNEIKDNIRHFRIADYSNLDDKYKNIINKTITVDSKDVMKTECIVNAIDNIIKNFDGSKVVVHHHHHHHRPPPPPPSIPEVIYLPTSKDEEKFEEVLMKSVQTHTINFYGNRYGDKKIKHIVDYFCKRLRNKDLYQVKDDVINNEEIYCLNLEGNIITHEGMKSLVTIFQYMPNLTKLYLNSNNFGNKGVEILADNLKYLFCLKILDISHNKIKDEGLYYLSDRCKRGLTVFLNQNKYTNYDRIRKMFNNKHINTGDSRC